MRGGVKTIFTIVASLFSSNLVDFVLLSGLIPRLEDLAVIKNDLCKLLEEGRKNALIIRHDF